MVREWGLPWIRHCLVCYRVLYSLTVRRWGVSLTENFMCFWRNKQPNTLHFPCMFMYICCYIRIDTIILHRYRILASWLRLSCLWHSDRVTHAPHPMGGSIWQANTFKMDETPTDRQGDPWSRKGETWDQDDQLIIDHWSLINQYNSHAQPFFFSHNISSILSRALFSRLKA